jgi:hypothetical protein
MSSHGTDLAVRGQERYQCGFPSLLVVATEHQKLIKLDKSSPGGGGPVPVQVVDLSMGGLGLRSPVFFPLSCRLVITLQATDTEPELSVPLRLQRVMMLDRAPSYYLGTAFETLTPEQTRSIASFVDRLKSSGAALVPEKPRA